MSEQPDGPPPKSSPDQPPAADGPNEESKGPIVGGAPPTEPRDARGRAANDPSMAHDEPSEYPQAPPGKPDGEVDTR
ncbi:MAG TPA: hypothetical protein VHW74_12710 [Mycobacteriales bacterium]|jgi:hypothetical protein|nr:hypothetical protein [Mycobacteriales bacterium]